MSLSLVGAASAATTGPVTDNPSLKVGPQPQITIGDEEISDVKLSTFYVFDKENSVVPQLGDKLAWGCRCGGGCRGCRCGGGCGWRGCGGCGGCGGGCCASWGRCRWC